MNTTIRDQIMENLKQRFEAQVEGANGALITWDVVTREPPTHNQMLEGRTIGLYDTSERGKPLIGSKVEKRLNVVVEFHCKVLDGDSVSQTIQFALGEVQRVMRSDITCGGLTFNLIEKGNELDISGPDQTLPVGMAIFEVWYRHNVNNPFQL